MSIENEKNENPATSPTLSTEDLQEQIRQHQEWGERLGDALVKGLNRRALRDLEEPQEPPKTK